MNTLDENDHEPEAKIPEFLYNYTLYELDRLARGDPVDETDSISCRLEEYIRNKRHRGWFWSMLRWR